MLTLLWLITELCQLIHKDLEKIKPKVETSHDLYVLTPVIIVSPISKRALASLKISSKVRKTKYPITWISLYPQ